VFRAFRQDNEIKDIRLNMKKYLYLFMYKNFKDCPYPKQTVRVNMQFGKFAAHTADTKKSIVFLYSSYKQSE
jgi:hypothetical protein